MAIELLSEVKGTASFQNTVPVKANVAVEKVEGTDNVSRSLEDANQTMLLNQSQSENVQNASLNDDKQEKYQQDKQSSETSMKSTSKDINKLINKNTIAEFGYHEATNRITIKIKDKNTNEIIREIPSEKALEMLEKAWEIAGILVDEKR